NLDPLTEYFKVCDFRAYSIRRALDTELHVSSVNIHTLLKWLRTATATMNKLDYVPVAWKEQDKSTKRLTVDDYLIKDDYSIHPTEFIHQLLEEVEHFKASMNAAEGSRYDVYYARMYKVVMLDVVEIMKALYRASI